MASVPFWLMKKKPYQQGLGFNTATEDNPWAQPPLRNWPHGYPAPGHWGGYEHRLGPTIVQRDEKPISDPTVSYSINPNLNPSIPDDFIRSGIEALHGKDEGDTDAAGNPAMYLRDEDSPYLQAQGRANVENFPDMPWSMRNLVSKSSASNINKKSKKSKKSPTTEERAEAWKLAMEDAAGFMSPMQGDTIPGVAPGGGSREHQMGTYGTGGYDLTSNRPTADPDAVRKRLYGIMGFA